MSLPDLLALLCGLGVSLTITGDELKLRAPRGVISAELRESVAARKGEIVAAFGDGVYPDPTLPDVIRIPVWCPNTETAIRSCIESQRKAAA